MRSPSAPTACAWSRPSSPFAWAATCRRVRRPTQQAEVLAAVAALHLALEIPDSRYADFVTAGGAAAHRRQCLRPPLRHRPAGAGELARRSIWRRIASSDAWGSFEGVGTGANVLGDPRIALTWLANELSRLGVTLAAGQIVTTGTCVTPMAIAPGDVVAADFGAFGTIGLRFAAARS